MNLDCYTKGHFIRQLKLHPDPTNDRESFFSLAELKACVRTTVEEPIEGVYVAVQLPEDPNGCWLCFAAFERTLEDDEQVGLRILFAGEGTGSNLRELRHTYWAPDRDGYLFYMPIDKTIASLTVLKKHFDGDN